MSAVSVTRTMSGDGAAAVSVRVRDGRREDVPAIHRMIHELAQFEGSPEGPLLSVDDLIEDGFESRPPWFFLVVAESRGELVGYALCNRAYSSWTRRALYVEDLYVRPEQRGQGVGQRIMGYVCAAAVTAGVQRVDWHVLETNEDALRFYRRLGAVDLRQTEGRTALRLTHPHIQRLAADFTPQTPT